MLIIDDVNSLSQLRQFGGRGARRHDHRCDVYICVPAEGVLASSNPANAEQTLKGRLLYDATQAKYKVDVCERLHGQASKATTLGKKDSAVLVLNDSRYEIYADEGVKDTSAQQMHYGLIRDVWEGLPATVEELRNEGIF